ncbi:hypothetical protein [Caldimonas sp. KR1-144]|uniref:hypothetical protein n=1 Tax=Caldimonas sp. KR1-144 TaxID=3400911 RepID=UPI003C122AAE
MICTLELNGTPVAIDLGKRGVAAMTADVTFMVEDVQYCANYRHLIHGRHVGPKSRVVRARALNLSQHGQAEVRPL